MTFTEKRIITRLNNEGVPERIRIKDLRVGDTFLAYEPDGTFIKKFPYFGGAKVLSPPELLDEETDNWGVDVDLLTGN